MPTEDLASWLAFKARLSSYAALPLDRRRQLVFRGQADATWPIQPTIDRLFRFASQAGRRRWLTNVLDEFRTLARGVAMPGSPQSDTEWEILARHHGAPTSLLDWTESPYIAAFFALSNRPRRHDQRCAIWVLDLALLAQRAPPGVEILNAPKLTAMNPRAIEQRGVCLRIGVATPGLSEELPVFRMTLPITERTDALVELDDMMINRRNLFRDLDGAAQTATFRAELRGNEP